MNIHTKFDEERINNEGTRLENSLRQGWIFSKSKIQENAKKHISNLNFEKLRICPLDHCIINIHTKFEQDRINNEGSRLGKLKVAAAAGTAAAAEPLSTFILGEFQTVIKIEPRGILACGKEHSLHNIEIYALEKVWASYNDPFYLKNDLENRPFRAS